MEKEKNIVVLYHAECPDGFGAAYAAWKKFGNKADYISLHNDGAEPPVELTGKDVYTLDFSYKLEVVKGLLLKVKSLTIIDHHISNVEQVKLVGGVYDVNHPGSVLSWKYFHPNKKLPRLFRNIEDIDIWKFKVPYTNELAEITTLYPFDFKVWDKLVKEIDTKDGLRKYVDQGKILVQKRDDQVKKIASYAEMVSFEGYEVFMVNSPVHVSHLGNFLCRKKGPIAVIWSRRGEKMIINLRSAGTVDVSKIAEKYGGGGHRAAAGFFWREKDFLKFKKETD